MKKILLFLVFFQILYANNIISIAIKDNNINLNPIYNKDEQLVNLLYLGLFYKDKDKVIKPALAKKYNVSKDGLAYEIELASGLYFKKDDINYGEFTSEDVKFTYDLIKDSLFKSKYKIYYDNIKEIKILSKYNIKFILKEHDGNFLNLLTLGVLSKNAVAKLGISYFNTDAIGLGPYYIKQKNNEQIILAKNTNSVIKTLNDGLIFKFYQNDVQIKNALNNNLIDVATIDYRYLKSLNLNININKIKSNKMAVLNLNNKIIDRRLRYALSLIICRKNIAQNFDYLEIFNDLNNDFYQYDCNRAKAKEIINEIGYFKDKKSIELNINKKVENNYYKKNNTELVLNIYANERNKFHVDIAKSIVQQLRDFGISANLLFEDNENIHAKIEDINLNDTIKLTDFLDKEEGENNKTAIENSPIVKKIKENYYKEFIKQIQLNPYYISLAFYDYYLVYNNKIKELNVDNSSDINLYSHAIYWQKHE